MMLILVVPNFAFYDPGKKTKLSFVGNECLLFRACTGLFGLSVLSAERRIKK
jgi:hypothetical protein